MRLVHSFDIKPNKYESLILGYLTYASARLFNVGLYERYEYKKLGFESMPNWYEQKRNLKNDVWFKSLPAQTAQDVLQRVDEGFKSYFKLLKTKGIKNPDGPHYKKKNSHFNIKYLNNSFKLVNNKIRLMIPKGLIKHLIEKGYEIKDRFLYIKLNKEINNIKQVEIKYISDSEYEFKVIYEIEDIELKKDNGRYVSIDMGINNLVTIYDNKGYSFIIRGNSYQNTLYYYNKKISYYQSLEAKYRNITNDNIILSTKRIKRLNNIKKRKIDYILHTSTKRIVDYCIENDINTVIIGDIKGIRENNNIGKINNQKLHSLPFKQFYDKLSYKLKMKGINLIYQNESYSSGCSPTSVDVSKEYYNKSKRIKRGLYKEDNIIYNSDSVGAYNIMRIYKKEKGIEIPMPIKGLSNPTVINVSV
jgi:IS605 OrfB family transposase